MVGMKFVCLLVSMLPCSDGFDPHYKVGYDTFERFPLSGGWRDGMAVTVDFKNYSLTATLSFRTAGDEEKFMVQLYDYTQFDLKRMVVQRDDLHQVWEKTPMHNLPYPSGHTFTFLKSGRKIMSFIDGEWMPWMEWDLRFDFPEPVPYLWVDNAFEAPAVTVQRFPCERSCSPDECTDVWGNSVCQGENFTDPSNCTVKVEESGSRVTKCIRAAYPSVQNGACCRGTATLLSKDQVQGPLGEYNRLEVVSDEARVNKYCGSPCAFKKNQQLRCADSLQNEKVWSYCFNTTHQYSDDVRAPYPILMLSHIRVYNFTLSADDIKSTSLVRGPLDRKPAFWVSTSGVSGLQGLFVLMLLETGSLNMSSPWLPVTGDRFKYWSNPTSAGQTAGVRLLASNWPVWELPSAVECTDIIPANEAEWMDQKNRTCAVYGNKTMPLCTDEGKPTEAWKTVEPDAADLYDPSIIRFQVGAPVPCCACGGGAFGGHGDQLPSFMSSARVLSSP